MTPDDAEFKDAVMSPVRQRDALASDRQDTNAVVASTTAATLSIVQSHKWKRRTWRSASTRSC